MCRHVGCLFVVIIVKPSAKHNFRTRIHLEFSEASRTPAAYGVSTSHALTVAPPAKPYAYFRIKFFFSAYDYIIIILSSRSFYDVYSSLTPRGRVVKPQTVLAYDPIS